MARHAVSPPRTAGQSTLIAALAAILCLLAINSTFSAEKTWKIGVSKVVITPEVPLWMAGYASRTKPAEGKLTELFAKCVLLEDADGRRAALVTLDLVGIDREFAADVCRAIEKQHQLPRAAVMLSTSHTHSGPVATKVLRPMYELVLSEEEQRKVDRYTRSLGEKIVQSVGEAIASLAPGTLLYSEAVATFAVNRRTNVEAEVPRLQASKSIQGPSDHRVPVILARGSDGATRAILLGYACHATTLSGYEWCADYPGFACELLEKEHPGAVALFWAGCGADQNPLPRRTVELARSYGAQLAAATSEALAKQQRVIQPQLSASYRTIDLGLTDLPTREMLEAALRGTNKYEQARAKSLLAILERGEPLPSTYPYPVQTWKLGNEVTWVALGGEVVVDYALRIAKEQPEKTLLITGYANDVMAYIPSLRVLKEGGYEGGGAMVYYGLPGRWADDVEEKIIAEVRLQTGAAVAASQ